MGWSLELRNKSFYTSYYNTPDSYVLLLDQKDGTQIKTSVLKQVLSDIDPILDKRLYNFLKYCIVNKKRPTLHL